MINTLFVFLCSILYVTSFTQSDVKPGVLVIDLDKDHLRDSVYLDRKNHVLISKLSSQKFKAVKSQKIEFLGEVGLRTTKSGFEFYKQYMQAGYACQFRYNATAKKIQLIGMSRYEIGTATKDGSGESSVNMLTHRYIGNWNYFDKQKNAIVALPTIKQQMQLPLTFLDGFSEIFFNKFLDNCADLIENYKEKALTADKNLGAKIFKQPAYKGNWQYIYPFVDKSYVLALQYNINSVDASPIANNTTIYFGKIGANADKVFWKEHTFVHVVKNDNVKYEDYNNDGVEDLLLFVTTGGRGANEFYQLYLKNEQNKTLVKVQGFSEIVNPSYNAKHKVIVGYGYSGTNNYTIYRIKNNKVYQVGHSFEDADDLDLDSKIAQILKKSVR